MISITANYNDLLAPGVELYPFQVESVDYALNTRRCFVADEMGLGKSITALTCLEAENAYPAVIVCPASLRGNWMREIKKFLPHRSAQIICGNPYALDLDSYLAETAIFVINYDILDNWVDSLIEFGLEAAIFDESHYIKNPSSKRSHAAKILGESLTETYGPLVLCLTGTPINNRPAELIPQLRAMGQLESISPSQIDFKMKYGKGENLIELNERLRSTCFIRHERTDVTDLAPTRRIAVSLSLNGALDQYRRVEHDLIDWLRIHKGEIAAESATRAAGIVRLNTLRRLVSVAKLGATIEWINNFIDSNPKRKLVVFAHHTALQNELAGHYGSLFIGGGQTQNQIEATKKLFQEDPDERIIICSLSAAREGHTLTAASDVLFVEEPWTPAAFDQAADRCNRIGQTQDVTAWSLLAEETVDWKIHDIIERKRVMFSEAIIGTTYDTESAQLMVLQSYIPDDSELHV